MTTSPSWITVSPSAPAEGIIERRAARLPGARPGKPDITPGEYSNGVFGENHSGNDTGWSCQRAWLARCQFASVSRLGVNPLCPGDGFANRALREPYLAGDIGAKDATAETAVALPIACLAATAPETCPRAWGHFFS